MHIEAGRAGSKSSADSSSHRNVISGRGTDAKLSPEEISLAWATHGPIGGWPDVEAVSNGSSGSGWIEAKAGTSLTCLDGGLLDLLSQNLSLKFLRLQGLESHHLELHHLQLQLIVHDLGRVERHAQGVHPTGSSLLGSKAVVGSIDGGGHRKIPVIISVALRHLVNLIAFVVVWESKSRQRLGEGGGIERTGWGGRVGYGGRAHASSPETGEKRGTIVGVVVGCRHGLRGEYVKKKKRAG